MTTAISSLPAQAVVPDYGDGGLLRLVQSFGAFLDGVPWEFPGCGPARRVNAPVLLFILIDGLGDAFLQRHGQGGTLLAHRRSRITSVFPSTTASAVTTMLTGVAPVTHGLTGWFIQDPRFGGIIAPLPMRMRAGGPVHGLLALRRLFPYRSLFQHRRRASVLVSPADIAWSPFSRRHARGAKIQAYSGLDGMIDATVAAARELRAAGGGYGYVYYPRFDALSHGSGSASDQVVEEFWRIDAAITHLLERLMGSGIEVVISADHGFIDSPDEQCVHVERYPELVAMLGAPLFGEARAAFCEVREGARADFEVFVRAELAGKARVLRFPDLLALGLLGPGPAHTRLRERIGSHALLMEPGWTVRDCVPGERVHSMLGVHGGLAPEEMWVPLIHVAC
jgi:hypothetical protein